MATLPEASRYEIDFRLAQKEAQFEEALVLAADVRLEAIALDGLVPPGQPVAVQLMAAVDKYYAGSVVPTPIVPDPANVPLPELPPGPRGDGPRDGNGPPDDLRPEDLPPDAPQPPDASGASGDAGGAP